MSKLKIYLSDRLKERTTWVGITLMLSSFGFPLTEIQQIAVIACGMALFGAPGTAFDINKK